MKRSFCIIINSAEIKKLIIHRLNKFNVSLFQLCESEEVDYKKFKFYLNSMNTDKAQATKIASQQEVIRIARALGISIGVQVVILSDDKVTAQAFDKEKEYVKINK